MNFSRNISEYNDTNRSLESKSPDNYTRKIHFQLPEDKYKEVVQAIEKIQKNNKLENHNEALVALVKFYQGEVE